MAIIPYLSFRKNTKEVIEFYEKALDATDINITTFADMGEDPTFPMHGNLVSSRFLLHLLLDINLTRISSINFDKHKY